MRLDGVPMIGSLRGQVHYEGDTIDLDASAPGLGGPLHASGRVRLGATTTLDHVKVTASGVDLARLPDHLPGLTGKVSANLTLTGTPTVRGLDASGWICSPRITLAGDAYADVGVWLTRTTPATNACKQEPPTFASGVYQGCTDVARSGGRCLLARARRVTGGDLDLAASIDARQRLGGAASIHGLPLAAIAALAGTALPAGADLDTDALRLGGTVAAPEVTGTIAITRAWVERAHLGDGELTVRGTGGGKVEVDLHLLDGRVGVHGTIGTTAPYPVELTAELDQVELDTFVDVVALGLPPNTRAWTSGRVHVETALADPKAPVVATLDLSDLSVSTSMAGPDGEPVPLTLKAAAPIELAYDGKEAKIVGSATFATPLGPVTLQGRASGLTVDLAANGRLDLVRAQPLLGRYFEHTAGTATLSAHVSGFTAAPRVQATIDLGDVALKLPRQESTLRVPSGRIELKENQLSFTGVSVEVDDGFSPDKPTLSVIGGIGLKGLVPANWGLIIEGDLAGEMLVAVAPQVFSQASGTADVDLRLQGTGATPEVKGELTFDREHPLTVLPRSLRREIALTDGSVSFTTEEITFDEVGATIDDEGRVRGIDGAIELHDGALASASLSASADGLPFRFGRSLDLVLDVQDLRMAYSPTAGLDIGGTVTIVDGRFVQNFDIGEFVRPSASSGPAAPPVWEAWPPLGNARLKIGIDVRKFVTVSNLFTLDASGAVKITGTPRDPRVEGNIQIADGTIQIPGMKAIFSPTTGTASFSPLVPLSTDTIDLTINSEARYVESSGTSDLINLRLSGPLSRLTWDLSTDTLNKSQVLTLIFAGRTPAQLRANLGSQTVGADPTRIDPSTDTSQGYADELIRQLAGDMLTSG
ncbi:MAG TPA: hypothetical protein VHE35_28035, partial [Kofleriaceae bacterium]|nr:hypothetical protein [Kofleriaceae bacterium]